MYFFTNHTTGTTPDDCKLLCMKMEEARLDFVDLSGGTFEGRAFEHKKESTVSTGKTSNTGCQD